MQAQQPSLRCLQWQLQRPMVSRRRISGGCSLEPRWLPSCLEGPSTGAGSRCMPSLRLMRARIVTAHLEGERMCRT